jgi:2-polyprenyl-6-methoxyphenol hydroxylase-like FAD-dependent oxidoreductase
MVYILTWNQNQGRGQGLNHAINDAQNIVAAIKRVESGERIQVTAIGAYRDEVVERGAIETQ